MINITYINLCTFAYLDVALAPHLCVAARVY